MLGSGRVVLERIGVRENRPVEPRLEVRSGDRTHDTGGLHTERVGRLQPYTEYFYVWVSGTDVSPVGRARTLPHPTSNQPLNLGFGGADGSQRDPVRSR